LNYTRTEPHCMGTDTPLATRRRLGYCSGIVLDCFAQ